MSPEEQTVQRFGQQLFDVLFNGEIRTRYDVSQQNARQQRKGLRLRLRIQPPELAALPWELLFDARRNEYLCLSTSTPLVRYIDLPHPSEPLGVAAPLRILAMIASPNNMAPLRVERERERLERALADLQARGLVELHWLNSKTWRDLQRERRRGPWHIFQFIGHGGFDSSADKGFLAFADTDGDAERMGATRLARLLADHASLRLTLLNACEGARAGRLDIFASTAATLVRRGLSAVVAMQYEITDDAAINFTQTFYESLADGLPIDEAVTEARKAMSIASNNSAEWGVPVLHLRAPDGVLFTLDELMPREMAHRTPIDPIIRLLQASNARPVAGRSLTLKAGYVGDEFELAREYSVIMTIDAVTQQWDRYSGGNVAIRKDDQGRAHFYATDEGGADISGAWKARNLGWFSRFDRSAIQKLADLKQFLDTPATGYLGYSDPEVFVVDLRSLFSNERGCLCSTPQEESGARAGLCPFGRKQIRQPSLFRLSGGLWGIPHQR